MEKDKANLVLSPPTLLAALPAPSAYRVTGKECNLEHLSMYLVKKDML